MDRQEATHWMYLKCDADVIFKIPLAKHGAFHAFVIKA